MLQSPSLERPFQITQIANGHSQAVRETHDKTIEGVTRLAIFQKCLAALPLETYQAGQTVIAEGSRTGRLLILVKGKVAIVKEDTEIATVAEPGALFGELSALLDQPHTADVRALENLAVSRCLRSHPSPARSDRSPLRCYDVGTSTRCC